MKKELTEDDEKEIIQLYLDKYSITEIRLRFHIQSNKVKQILLKNNIKIRTKEENILIIKEKVKQTSLRKYGVESPNQLKEIKEKKKLMYLKRYGVDNPNKSKEIRKKTEQTCLNKYGVENPFKAESIKEKIKQTCLERYGVNNPAKSDSVQQKIKQTCLERYGTENPGAGGMAREKYKQTCLERYGVDNPNKVKKTREKLTQTCLEKYGTSYYWQSNTYKDILLNRSSEEWNKIKQKEYITKKERGTFNTSKPEDLYYEYLLSLYTEDDIIRQYRSELYPFNCDFYIKSEDLYIECNYSWTHGGNPYDPNSIKDNIKLIDWSRKAETSDYYKKAIYTWTDLDVRKQKIAKKNNLNYLVLYNLQED